MHHEKLRSVSPSLGKSVVPFVLQRVSLPVVVAGSSSYRPCITGDNTDEQMQMDSLLVPMNSVAPLSIANGNGVWKSTQLMLLRMYWAQLHTGLRITAVQQCTKK